MKSFSKILCFELPCVSVLCGRDKHFLQINTDRKKVILDLVNLLLTIEELPLVKFSKFYIQLKDEIPNIVNFLANFNFYKYHFRFDYDFYIS